MALDDNECRRRRDCQRREKTTSFKVMEKPSGDEAYKAGDERGMCYWDGETRGSRGFRFGPAALVLTMMAIKTDRRSGFGSPLRRT